MKHVKRYFLLLAVICMAGVILTRAEVRHLAGQATGSLKSYYVKARANAVNEKGFSLLYDGESIDTSNMRMSEEMHLLMSIADVVKYFGASVTIGSGSDCYIQGEYIEDGIVLSEQRTSETIFVDMNHAASALGLSCEWKNSEWKVVLNTLNKQELPARYDLRDYRTLTPVDNQGDYGTCWAFASTAALESSLSDESSWDFSVDHMTMNSGFNISPTQGGDYNMAIAYLSAWRGPVSEKYDPYGDGVTDASLKAEKHLQEAQFFNEKDLDYIKRMIMNYGGVESPIYMSIEHAWDASQDYQPLNSAYYYSGDMEANHDVVIIGWDDHFSRENFKHMPENDGAFICRNSWGTAFGNQGYFYVSYEDAVLGKTGVAYTGIENPDNYSTIYQTDMFGWVGTLGYHAPTAWFANVYTAQSSESLKAVSFYAVDGCTSYDIYVVPEYAGIEDLKEPVYAGSGYWEQGGYYTVDLPEMVHLKEGQKFAVMVCITTENSELPIAIEYKASDLTSGVDLSDGEGYVSYNGQQWTSTEDAYACNVCLKAFTD